MFGKKKRSDEPLKLDFSPRDKEIERLELERMHTNREIEQLLKSYAKESGDRKLKRRRFKVGKSPNDYGFADK